MACQFSGGASDRAFTKLRKSARRDVMGNEKRKEKSGKRVFSSLAGCGFRPFGAFARAGSVSDGNPPHFYQSATSQRLAVTERLLGRWARSFSALRDAAETDVIVQVQHVEPGDDVSPLRREGGVQPVKKGSRIDL